MIVAPPGGVLTPGPLAEPEEAELAGAYAELRDEAPTLCWAAEALGAQPSRLLALAEAGALVVVPGPWSMRQAHGRLGAFVPAWQLAPGGRALVRGLAEVIDAAARAGWTSLRLHRFMTTPLWEDGPTPAALLRAGASGGIAASIKGEAGSQPTVARTRPRPRRILPRTARAQTGTRRPAPRAARPRPPRGGAASPAGQPARARDSAAPGGAR